MTDNPKFSRDLSTSDALIAAHPGICYMQLIQAMSLITLKLRISVLHVLIIMQIRVMESRIFVCGGVV